MTGVILSRGESADMPCVRRGCLSRRQTSRRLVSEIDSAVANVSIIPGQSGLNFCIYPDKAALISVSRVAGKSRF